MSLKNIILLENSVFNENKYLKLVELAKKYNYDEFIKSTDRVAFVYDILYRGMMSDDTISDKSFFTDYVGHAEQYGEYVDGILISNKDILFIDDNEFESLRAKFNTISIQELQKIYKFYFDNYKLFDAMVNEYDSESSVLKFVLSFIKSNHPYTKIQQHKIKNDLLVPIMLHHAELKNKNIISFLGGDYSDYGGADEFVVNNTSKYIKLSDFWKEINELN